MFAKLDSEGKPAQRQNRPVLVLVLVPTQHKQQRRCLSKNTGRRFFIQTRGATPCTENKIYFPLLLLYVKLEHFQSSELLQSLSRSAKLEGLFSTEAPTFACCHVEISSLCSVPTKISSCTSCFSLLLRLLYKLVLYLRG